MGKFFIWAALAATLLSAWQYYRALNTTAFKGKKKDRAKYLETSLKNARRAFYVMSGLVAVASAYLLYLILAHQFQFEYVFRYSGRNLGPGLLLSTFWAGQAGSFLLWALLTALMGIVLMRTARKLEIPAMLFLSVIQGFFLVLLVKVSPFVQTAHMPPDGNGLNPLLQNFWMIIHPPILFLGYAAAVVPMVLALAALVQKQYDEWLSVALPWALFTSFTLGAGIIIGGYWAYGTLGWGGYWGWDPVENSSLVPWMINFALFHGMLIQKTRGSLKRTNFVLAILSFAFVLYATFLTRSGVLADFSVHSFQDLGINGLLILFLASPLVGGAILLVKRNQQITTPELGFDGLSRENTLFVGMLILLASTLVIILGTSFPLISRIFTKPSNVNISFYNTVNLPLMIAMSFVLGITPFLKWGSHQNGYRSKLLISLALSLVTTAAALLAGVTPALLLVFVATSAFAFWTNLIVFYQQARLHILNSAAPLAHLGLALMFLGIIVSGYLDQEQYVKLTKGVPAEALGHEMLYEGSHRPKDGKDVLRIQVKDATSAYLATPRLFYTKFNDSMMKEPFIKSGWFQDFYISPLERVQAEPSHNHSTLSLKKGEKKKIEGYEIRFASFNMGEHSEKGVMKIGANLEVGYGSRRFTLAPAMEMAGDKRRSLPVPFPEEATNGHKPSVFLQAVNATDRSIQLGFDGMVDLAEDAHRPVETIAVQVSTKPFMNVLWLGTVLLTLGAVLAMRKRLIMH